MLFVSQRSSSQENPSFFLCLLLLGSSKAHADQNLFLTKDLCRQTKELSATSLSEACRASADHFLTVTRRWSLSHSHSDCSLTVTQLALSQLLGADRSLAVTRLALTVTPIAPKSWAWRDTAKTCPPVAIWLWQFVHGITFIMMSMATCPLQFVDWRFIHGNSFKWFRTLSTQIVLATIPGVRSPIGIRSMSMTARPGQCVHNTSFMTT